MYIFYLEFIIYILFFVLFISLIIKLLVQWLLNRYLDEISNTIKILSENINSDINYKSPALNRFYDEIYNMQKIFKKRECHNNEIFKILNSAAINMELDKFLNDFIPKILNATDSFCGAFYLLNDFTNKLELKYSCGFDKNIYREFDLNAHEFFAHDFNIKVNNNIPNDTIYMSKTFVGKIKPKSIMTVPIVNQDKLIGILIFAGLYNYTDDQIEIVNLTKNYIGIAVNNGVIFERTQRLTNELQFQNRLIQDLNDELENKLKNASDSSDQNLDNR